MKRIISLILSAAMLLTVFCFNITAHSENVRVADPETLNDWQHLFGEEVIHTGNAGAVWSDKSVLTDPSVLGVELSDPDNFAVALSALASELNITGYSGVPADTMLIIESSDTQTAAEYIERAAAKLIESNNHNRIGAVIYSKDNSYILPIGQYTSDISGSLSGVDNCSNFQQAMYKAYVLFMAVEDTTIEGDGIQSGSKRMPICLMMTKSEFTEASSNFSDLSAADLSTEEAEYAQLVPFAMQLTAAYAKASVEKHYDHEAFVYTLGSISDAFDTKSTASCWDVYEAAQPGSSVQFAAGKTWVRDNGGYWQTLYKSFKKTAYPLSRDFVTERYTSESDFDTVTDEIVGHCLKDPTYVEGDDDRFGGYIEFIDDIGRYMEVKDIKGIRLAGTLYTGEALAKNFVPGGGSLGTVASPNDLGNEMIWAVMERLGIDSLATAQQLISLAYRSGQLSYNPETGQYSNYIGWYADKDGKFISHATDSDSSVPPEAVYYNKSYGFTGGVADGYKSADMMYVSVQVHTRIATGTQAVIFRVPAALIPVIRYNVSFGGDSLDDPGAITLERDSRIWVDTVGDGRVDKEVDITPIRLVYEVGIRSDIDDITVHSIVDEGYEHVVDGVYTFYTNRWDMDDIGHPHPSQAKNTVSFFSPSPENERYYYTQNTTIYELIGGEYIPYNGSEAPVYESGRFFRDHNVYEFGDSPEGGNAIIHTHYEEISESSLTKAKRADNGSWYIPKGTVYRYFEDHEHFKSENLTDTLPYSHYVNVESVDDTGAQGYYVDYILGNNGMITLKAAEGIRLSSVLDETMKGRVDPVTVEITAPDGNYRLVSYKNGKKETTLTVSGGKANVELDPNSELYIVDVPKGTELTLSVLTEDKDYRVKSANGGEGKDITLTVEASRLLDAEFTLSLTEPEDSGMLVLGCDVIHPLGRDADPSYHEFSFDISYNGKTEQITLKHGESAVIKDIPIGAEVTLTETNLPEGFTSDKENDTEVISVEKPGIYVVGFTNTYSPKAASANNITVSGDVTLTGREMLAGDKFVYKLQKLSNTEWTDLGEVSVTKADPKFDFTSCISAESYNTPGVYSYRILPVIGENPHNGVTYDKVARWFEIVVTDNDWDGSLEIYSIVGFNGGIVSKNNYKWNLHSSFSCDYRVTGNDAVSVIVDTVIEGNNEISLDGYIYGLYQNGELVQTFPVSDQNGESVLTLSYSAADIGNSIDYTVKQLVPADPVDNIAYSDKEYTVTVKIEDSLTGNPSASITAEGSTAREAYLTFINTYIPTVSENTTADTTDTIHTDFTAKVTTTQNRNKNDPPANSPMTGDMGIGFWCVLLMGSAAIIVIIICTKKRKTVKR